MYYHCKIIINNIEIHWKYIALYCYYKINNWITLMIRYLSSSSSSMFLFFSANHDVHRRTIPRNTRPSCGNCWRTAAAPSSVSTATPAALAASSTAAQRANRRPTCPISSENCVRISHSLSSGIFFFNLFLELNCLSFSLIDLVWYFVLFINWIIFNSLSLFVIHFVLMIVYFRFI